MNRKAIFLSKRLDRIAPKSDRTLIALSLGLALVSVFVSCMIFETAISRNLQTESVLMRLLDIIGLSALPRTVGFWLVGIAAAVQTVSLFLIIKETIRNRFYSAVWILACNIVTTALFITSAVLLGMLA